MKKTTKVTSPLAQAKASLRAGFSLIELLVVIAVIGIIAAIAIPNIAGLTGGANDCDDQTECSNNRVSTLRQRQASGYIPPATRNSGDGEA